MNARNEKHRVLSSVYPSRKWKSELVIENPLPPRALENVFRAFGGVPKTLVIDNLKAAVKNADWFDPDITPKVVEFVRYYGTVIRDFGVAA